MAVDRRVRSALAAAVLLALGGLLVHSAQLRAAEPPPRFLRALNLNGPALEIDGRAWEGHDSKHYATSDQAFENQSVPIKPPTDDARARMIRSSRWNTQARIVLTDVPPGPSQMFVYVWEDNNSETFSLSLQGTKVADVKSGEAGEWQRLGPYIVDAVDGSITLTTSGGAANLSGIEIWLGEGKVPAPSADDVGRNAFRPTTPEIAQHFRRHIAPLISRHCLECHNATDRRGGLDLGDWRHAAEGGESGAAIDPGKPDDSLLWQYVDSGEMPKERTPLSADEKAVLRKWIADGAVWGEPTIDPFLATTSRRAGYDWWSLQPVRPMPIPEARDRAGMHNEIDAFIRARLGSAGLSPAPETDRRTLIRRLSFDLVGLPPRPEEVQRFTQDSDPRAYEKLVDRLLDSPHYGERWARHWLDVIRFGESQGYERNKIRDNAWRFRDWVIAAFNRNLPYDEFVRQQVAGDVLHPDDLGALLATGYHVCGTWDQVGFYEGSKEMQKSVRQDDLEDLVATLGQAFLGVTINCARCHDHKFDPISQREYYQIAALLSGVSQEEKERQGITLSPDPPRQRRLQEQLAVARPPLEQLEQDLRARYDKGPSGEPVAGLQALYVFEDTASRSVVDRSGSATPVSLEASDKLPFASAEPVPRLIQAVKKSGEVTLEAWLTPAKAGQSGPARIVTISLDTGRRNLTLAQDGDHFDVRLRTTRTDNNGLPSLAAPAGSVRTGRTHVVYTFARDGAAHLYVDGQRVAEKKIKGDLSNWDEGFRLGLGNELTGDRPWEGQFHFVALYDRALDEAQVRQHFETASAEVRGIAPIQELLKSATDAERAKHADLADVVRRLEHELREVTFPGVAHTIVPKQPPQTYVLARGDYRRAGELVAPAGLKALAGLSPDFGLAPDAPEARRRIKLAEWLTDPHNPLTPRVFVNRVWYYHFGQGLVDTPSDFGFNGGRPSHPELLDYLAARFVESGWDIKALHRLIVTSAAYRQQSQVRNARAEEVDADNRLLWRANARRLEGEAVRDAMLAVSGALNPQIGGPSFRDMKVDGGVMGTNSEFTDPTNEFSDNTCRRTIYRLWARCGNLPMLECLDCPDPTVMTPRRTQTITPLQALSLLNSPFAEQCARRFAGRVRADAGDDVKRQIDLCYVLALSRAPRDVERPLAETFIRDHGLDQFCLTLFNVNEFLFVD
jgi:hypothetical protein